MRINKKQEIAMWVSGLIGCALFLSLALDRAEAYSLGAFGIVTFLVIFSLRNRT